MKIEVLIATMNLKEHNELIENLKVKNSLVINQTNEILLDDITEGSNRLFSYKEKGLSKSRNKAIEKSSSDICVIADDDLQYENNYEEIIVEGYKKYPDADIIAFYVDNVDLKRKKAVGKEEKIDLIKSMKIRSVQITFKRKSIIDNKIEFNERFGAGAELYMGEENIFLAQCIKKGLKIYYIPNKIATIQDNESTWFKGHNEYNFNVKGAVYFEISKRLYPILILQFALRKRWLYSNELPMNKAIIYMFEGVKKYKKRLKKKVYYMGDFCSDTGPAIVNKSYYPYMKGKCFICKTNNKLIRLIHFLFNIVKCRVLLISGLSKFHMSASKIVKKMNKKVVYLMHGYNKVEYELNEIPKEKRILRTCEDEMLLIADKIICVSEKFCEYMKKQRKDIVSKFDFVNNGIESIESVVVEQKNKNDFFTVMSTGGGKKNKNNLDVCKAIEKLNNYKIKYIVIGEMGLDGDKIKEYNFVEYHSYLSHREVLGKMKKSDLYIQNSYFETFGLAIIEAISMGCEILISKDIGALSIIDCIEENNIIKNNKEIDEISNKIEKIINRKNRNKYISNIEKYTWKEEARKLKNKLLESEE